ncbi:unnamed protein product [Zymoseptoria tritici ST99CH_3D1]|nr:unnamed protein product [Zymoseptoria tritici ST99CH_3D1]
MAPQPTTPGVTINAAGKKSFIPLENNPEVFTSLMHNLGVSSKLTCHDIYTLDRSFLATIPRPVHALIFIAPGPVYHRVRARHDGGTGSGSRVDERITYDAIGPKEPILWFRQTIGNACGLYSLVHAVGNGSARAHVQPDTLIDRLLKQAEPLRRVERAAVLYDSVELERVHMAAAVKGDSHAPESQEKVGYHFITFVKGKDGHLWELEGSWDPIDRGVMEEGEDLLSERVVEMGVGKFVKEAEGNVGFSVVAVVTEE